MKILHINSYYSVSPFYKHLFDRQVSMGEEISVFVPVARGYDAKKRDFGAYTAVSEDHGRYDHLLFHGKHNKILRDAESRYDAKSFDLIHAHTLFSNGVIAYELHKKTGTPYIVAVRNSDINAFFHYMPHLRPLGKRILSAARRVLFISPAYRETEIRRYLSAEEYRAVLEKSEVLPNGIAPMWLEMRAEPRTVSGGPVSILSVGDVVKNKNFGTTIEAVRLLRDSGLDARLTIVGKPVDSGELDRIKACPFAVYREPMPQEELRAVYRAHDVFVLPSITETFGLVYAEAMSQGLPVIYSKDQGFDGQFPEGEVGFSAPAKDAKVIADRVRAVLRDYDKMSARCVEGSRRFDWDAIAAAYDGLYRGVLSE